MAYVDRPGERIVERSSVVAVNDYHDRVRWGPIFAGLAVTLSAYLIFLALGAAIGATNIAGSGAPRSNLDNVGSAIGTWSIISLFLSLLIGGWVTSRACGPVNRNTALLNGAILWATTLALSAWLVANGVSGAFGLVASNAGEIVNQVQQSGTRLPNPADVPTPSAQQTRDAAGDLARGGWSFVFGSLLGLAASLIGSTIGNRSPRRTTEVITNA